MSLVRETRFIWNITFNVNPAYLWPSDRNWEDRSYVNWRNISWAFCFVQKVHFKGLFSLSFSLSGSRSSVDDKVYSKLLVKILAVLCC